MFATTKACIDLKQKADWVMDGIKEQLVDAENVYWSGSIQEDKMHKMRCAELYRICSKPSMFLLGMCSYRSRNEGLLTTSSSIAFLPLHCRGK
jgi:hypothetical protein